MVNTYSKPFFHMLQNSFLVLARQKILRCEKFLEDTKKIIPSFYAEKETARIL